MDYELFLNISAMPRRRMKEDRHEVVESTSVCGKEADIKFDGNRENGPNYLKRSSFSIKL